MPQLNEQLRIGPIGTVFTDASAQLPYSWTVATGVAIETEVYALNNKSYEVGLASVFIEILTGGTAPTSFTVTHKFQMDRAGTYFGTAHDVDNDSSTNVVTTSSTATSYTLEANLQNQNWWKFSVYGGKFILTPTGNGVITVRNFLVCGI